MSALSPDEIAQARADLATTLPDSCTISRKTRVPDGGGGSVERWTPVATGVPCRLHPASAAAGGGAGMDVGGGRLNDETTHIVTLNPKTDVRLEDRIDVDGALFEVLTVRRGGAWELQRHAEVKGA